MLTLFLDLANLIEISISIIFTHAVRAELNETLLSIRLIWQNKMITVLLCKLAKQYLTIVKLADFTVLTEVLIPTKDGARSLCLNSNL